MKFEKTIQIGPESPTLIPCDKCGSIIRIACEIGKTKEILFDKFCRICTEKMRWETFLKEQVELLQEAGYTRYTGAGIAASHIIPPELSSMLVFSKSENRKVPYLVYEHGYGWYIEVVEVENDLDEMEINGTPFKRDYHYSDRLNVMYYSPKNWEDSADDGFGDCFKRIQSIYKSGEA